jgi:hypothetical protein
MATIKQNVNELRDAILREKDKKGSTFISDVRNAAVKATRGGVSSLEWKTFMTIFADNPEQLERLTVKDGDPSLVGREYILDSAAYMVGGSICTSETVAHLPHRIDDRIDEGLSDVADAVFAALKVLTIPKPTPPVQPASSTNPPPAPPANPVNNPSDS